MLLLPLRRLLHQSPEAAGAVGALCGVPAGAAAARPAAVQHGSAGKPAALHRQLHPADIMHARATLAGWAASGTVGTWWYLRIECMPCNCRKLSSIGHTKYAAAASLLTTLALGQGWG